MVTAMTKSSSACLDINRRLCCLLKAITKNFKVNPPIVYVNGEIVASIQKSEVAKSKSESNSQVRELHLLTPS
jgi:hypothetical protein